MNRANHLLQAIAGAALLGILLLSLSAIPHSSTSPIIQPRQVEAILPGGLVYLQTDPASNTIVVGIWQQVR